jgi:Holliday junction resolvase
MSTDTHDRKVRQKANELRNQGWKVDADLNRFEQPDPIGRGNYIPDVFATKGKRTKIIEVDTPNSINKQQLGAFKRSAIHRKNADFEHIITRPRKTKRS